jgi:putative SOS response-associated peptidase YedK
MLRWGLIPSWAKDPKIGNQCINAKAETVAEKPSFRSAFKKRRCLVIATGFYEWQVHGARKQPMWIGLRSQQPFAFAGLWEHWTPVEGEPLETCTIITTEPNDLMAPIHNRIPVILAPTAYDQWLDPTFQHVEPLKVLLRPYPSEELAAYPVSTLVNNPRHDAPQCLEPVLV